MRIRGGLVATLIWFAAAPSAQPVSAAPPEPAPPLKAAVRSKIDSDVRALLSAAHAQGATIAIVQNGAIVYTRGYGLRDVAQSLPADTHTRYEIGSITKQFTAAAILQLKEAGKIDLNATVATYLQPFSHAKEITIRQLLTHTSGYQDYYPLDFVAPFMEVKATPQHILDMWAKKALDFDPEHKGALEYLGELYVQTGELAKAREHVVLLTKLCPQGCEELEDLQKALAQAGTPKTN